MSDDIDHDGLYSLAESQAGYFAAGEALAAGMDRSTLRYHARPGGRYERVSRGLYRLRHFPSSQYEEIVAAWLPLRNAEAVVSHETALDLRPGRASPRDEGRGHRMASERRRAH